MNSTVSANFRVQTKEGMHARPCAQMHNLAKCRGVNAEFRDKSGVFKVVSIMAVMMQGFSKGEDIEMRASGEKAEEYFDALTREIKEGSSSVLKRIK